MRYFLLSFFLFISALSADSLDKIMDAFDDDLIVKPSKKESNVSNDNFYGIRGEFKEQVAYSYSGKKPHNGISSLKSSLFLDYEHKFENSFRFKTNLKAYYDSIYKIRENNKYEKDEIDELESEIELYDAYIEGTLADNLDIKLGRQVVVWGRSDTIRVTDILNPLDSRRPGIVDIEDLRLPIGMVKIDYFLGDWSITPIAIFEHRYDKTSPKGSPFNPFQIESNNHDSFEFTPALSIGGEFSGWDIDFYFTQFKVDSDKKSNMFGTALNILNGSWLFKSELAYFDERLERIKGLIGFEYRGILDTSISYDVAMEKIESQNDNYQHAFRVSSDFINATLQANYLISTVGFKLKKGAIQRAWLNYDIADNIDISMGVVDYIGGTYYFDAISDADMVFLDISYSF